MFTGNDLLDYKAGHFLTIAPQQFPALERWTAYLENLKGKKELPRAYSMSSCPQEKYLAITINENILNGRVSKEILAKYVEDASHQYVYACGPSISAFDKKAAKEKGLEPAPRFLESVLQYLQELGFSPDRIKRESYG